MKSNNLFRTLGVALTIAVLTLAGCDRGATPPPAADPAATPSPAMPPASAASQ